MEKLSLQKVATTENTITNNMYCVISRLKVPSQQRVFESSLCFQSYVHCPLYSYPIRL